MSMSALPPEKLSVLRQLIHSHVSREDLQDQIRGCVADSLATEAEEGGRVDEEAVMRVLEERGIVEQVLQALNLSGGEGDVAGRARRESPRSHVENRREETTEARQRGEFMAINYLHDVTFQHFVTFWDFCLYYEWLVLTLKEGRCLY